MKERTLALAGLFQATELVRQAANHGTWSGYAASSSLQSLYVLESDTIADIYGGGPQMRLGGETLISGLQGENRYADSLRYAVGLLQIEKKFRHADSMQEQVGNRLKEIARIGEDLEQHEREDLQAHGISTLYTDTISHMSPRIVVNGKPQHLKNERTVDWVRTLLLAGLRSAILWHQMGGGRFELIFGRKNILREAETLLMN